MIAILLVLLCGLAIADGRVVINASSDTAGGFGKSDSAWIQLVTVFNNETFSILKADTFASVPCTLSVNDSSLTNFFTEKLKAVVYISDTVMSMSSVQLIMLDSISC